MSYKDDEEVVPGIDLGEEDEDVLLSPDDLDDSLIDDDLLLDDDLAGDEEDDELEDFAGLDGSSEY